MNKKTASEAAARGGIGNKKTSGSAISGGMNSNKNICLVYKVSGFTYYLAKGLIAVNFLGMANILAGRELVRELIQYDASPEKIASEILRLIESKEKRDLLSKELESITEPLAEPGSYERAAIATLGVIKDDVRGRV